MEMMDSGHWLPVAFTVLMGVAVLAYVVLDGYDLGVGILMADADDAQRDRMVASIGPFWDANETWLVLAVGLLLVAFPVAHGMILGALYLPVAAMLLGLILRGVSFEFRAKTEGVQRRWWNQAFIAGSLLAALAQGYMLGLYVLGLPQGPAAMAFGMLTGLCLAAGYAFIGAAWLILKTDGPLQAKAVVWARRTLGLAALGMVAVSVATPLASGRIAERWFALPELFLLAPVPLMAALLFGIVALALRGLPRADDRWSWVPFAGAVGIFVLGFHGLAYSFFPYVVPERLTVWEAASAPESLMIILVGAAVVLPLIAAYTLFVYRVFRGKATELRYD
ncbi:cytochrome d ubiquinol oxidase subunit II [Rhodospirillum centenum]|uniref:Quinol oxidase, subunit II, putative n=1 Tax=Rhodospirillum centenum (strain ATCC 51521 / SW) TaxID=414684 RepID=B6IQJ9_RHOCS|nr:cytochrome d ubiquinol oxidase subunit II [Rhodospirillum centenum]ACI97735.1 quinol oxidase, subunit II, putative [Rhodospirillum centenum SW]